MNQKTNNDGFYENSTSTNDELLIYRNFDDYDNEPVDNTASIVKGWLALSLLSLAITAVVVSLVAAAFVG